MRRALARVLLTTTAALGALAWVASASSSSETTQMSRYVQAGAVAEIRLSLTAPDDADATLVRIDGIRGWQFTRFGPDGYNTRAFCSDDMGPDVVRRTRDSIALLGGGLRRVSSCQMRLFFIPTRAGRYTLRVHLVTGELHYLMRHAGTVNGKVTLLRVAVAPPGSPTPERATG